MFALFGLVLFWWNGFGNFLFSLSVRAKPQRPGLHRARLPRVPPNPRRSLPQRVTPGPLTHQALQRPGRYMAALHRGEVRVTWPVGGWDFRPPPLHLQPQDHRVRQRLGTTPVCCGWTSIVRALWRLWSASREIRAVPISCCTGWGTGTNTTVGEPLPNPQVSMWRLQNRKQSFFCSVKFITFLFLYSSKIW